MWKKVVSVGEEKLSQLASSEVLMTFLKSALTAREQAVDAVKNGLRALNVPSLDDVKKLDQKLDELKVLFDDISDALDKKKS